MFFHAFDGYMTHAYPRDELMPISCSGRDTLGGYALTLIDTLDTLAVMGHWELFEKSIHLVEDMRFDLDQNVSVFETNIRIVGGLLSAHLMAEENVQGYDGSLLRMAVDCADRLLPAFTHSHLGIPIGTVNLRHGVPRNETPIVCTAAATTFTLEFGVLSALTDDAKYGIAAWRAVSALWEKRSALDLVGAYINCETGRWKVTSSGIGGGVDSFFEYLLKGAVLFRDTSLYSAWVTAYNSIKEHMHRRPWYIDVNMVTGLPSNVHYESLQSFWPGLLVLDGEVEPASLTMHAFQILWRFFGFVPEGYDLEKDKIEGGRSQYPLRPEMIESIYYLYRATKDPIWLDYAEEMMDSLNLHARTTCGFAAVENIVSKKLRDHMDSFFLSELCKYLYLIFDEENEINSYPGYVFNTEGHPIPVSERWATHSFSLPGSCAAVIPPLPFFLLPPPPPPVSEYEMCAAGENDRNSDVVRRKEVSVELDDMQLVVSLDAYDAAVRIEAIALAKKLRGVPEPEELYTGEAMYASFGTQLVDECIEGELSLAGNGCSALGRRHANKVLLVRRGACDFAEKAKNADEAGAIAMIVYDPKEKKTDAEQKLTMTGEVEVKLPCAFLPHGQVLKNSVLKHGSAVVIRLIAPESVKERKIWINGRELIISNEVMLQLQQSMLASSSVNSDVLMPLVEQIRESIGLQAATVDTGSREYGEDNEVVLELVPSDAPSVGVVAPPIDGAEDVHTVDGGEFAAEDKAGLHEYREEEAGEEEVLLTIPLEEEVEEESPRALEEQVLTIPLEEEEVRSKCGEVSASSDVE